MAKKQSAAAANLQALMNSGVLPGISARTENATVLSPTSPPDEIVSLQATIETKSIQEIPLDRLLDNPYQPRTTITVDQELQEMAEGIKKYGLLGAFPARKHPQKEGYYQLGFGHRRREASRLAGKTTMPIILEDLDNAAMAGLAAVENIHRVDLTPLELGNLFLNMRREGYTQDEIANAIKKDRGYVVNRLRVAEADPDIQAFIEAKPTSLRAVSYLIKVKNSADRALLISHLKEGTLTADDLSNDLDTLLTLLKEPQEERETPQMQANSSDPSALAITGATLEQDIQALDTEETQNSYKTSSTWEHKIGSSAETTKPSFSSARIRVAKLRTLLRNFSAYKEALDERTDDITRKEQELLQQISDVFLQIRQQADFSLEDF